MRLTRRRRGRGRPAVVGHTRLYDQVVEDSAERVEVVHVEDRLLVRLRRDLLQFLHVNTVRDTDGHYLDAVVSRLSRVRLRQLYVPGRLAIRDDNGDVVHHWPVSVRRLVDDVVHEVQPARCVGVAVEVGQGVDALVQVVLRVELVQLELDATFVGEEDEGYARVVLADGEAGDDALEERLHAFPVVRVRLVDAPRRIDDETDVSLNLAHCGIKIFPLVIIIIINTVFVYAIYLAIKTYRGMNIEITLK